MLFRQRTEPFQTLWAEFYKDLTDCKIQVITTANRACMTLSKQIRPFVSNQNTNYHVLMASHIIQYWFKSLTYLSVYSNSL